MQLCKIIIYVKNICDNWYGLVTCSLVMVYTQISTSTDLHLHLLSQQKLFTVIMLTST